MAAMFHHISVRLGVIRLVTVDEIEYFVQTPNSLRLHGLDRKRKRGVKFAQIHQSGIRPSGSAVAFDGPD